MTRSLRMLAAGATTVVLAAGAALSAAPALASTIPADSFEIDYAASGTSHIAKPNSTIALGPTTVKNYISDSGDGSFKADISLPSTTASFKVLGFVPVKATVTLVPVGYTTGYISQDVPITLTATAKYYVKLTNVTAAGLPTFVGNKCQTSSPVTIPLATPKGQVFDLTDGGALSGTYTIGQFANCNLMTGLINLLVPGGGNTITFNLSDGQFVDNG